MVSTAITNSMNKLLSKVANPTSTQIINQLSADKITPNHTNLADAQSAVYSATHPVNTVNPVIANTTALVTNLNTLASTAASQSTPVAIAAIPTVTDNAAMIQDYVAASGDNTIYDTPVSLATGAAIAYGNNIDAIANDPSILNDPANAAIVAPAPNQSILTQLYNWFIGLFHKNSFDGYDNGADYYKAMLIHHNEIKNSPYFGERGNFDPSILADVLNVGGAGVTALNQDLQASGKAPFLPWLTALTGQGTNPAAANYIAPPVSSTKSITTILVLIVIVIVGIVIFNKLKKK